MLFMRSLYFALIALTFASLSACRERTPPTEALRTLDTPTIDAETFIPPVALTAHPTQMPADNAAPQTTVKGQWPPQAQVDELQAPEGESFLWVLPLPMNDGRSSYLAASLSHQELKDSAEASFSTGRSPTWSLLLYPADRSEDTGEDTDVQLIEELSSLRYGRPPATSSQRVETAPLAPQFYAQLQGDRLVTVCIPAPIGEGPSARIAATSPRPLCEFYLWNGDGTLQALPHHLEGLRRFEAPGPLDATTRILDFQWDIEGRLHSWLEVPLPTPLKRDAADAPSSTAHLFLEWEPNPLRVVDWKSTSISKELHQWLGFSSSDQADEQAALAAARLLVLRQFAPDVLEDADAYLAFEAQVLLQIGALLHEAWGSWNAWAWLAQLTYLLDTHADQALPRPQAALLMLDEEDEWPFTGWRGEGQLLDREAPGLWLTSGETNYLRLPRTAGVRYCSLAHCLNQAPDDGNIGPDRAVHLPSLRRPDGKVQLAELNALPQSWELLFTAAQRAQRCEAAERCAGSCRLVSYATLSRLTKFQGASYARQVFPRTPQATQAAAPTHGATVCGIGTSIIERPQPLFWLDSDSLLVGDVEGLYRLNLPTSTAHAFEGANLTDVQRSIAGFGADGERYILRQIADELSVWVVTTNQPPRLLALPGLKVPERPLSQHGWVLPSAGSRELAVIYGGQLLGVWQQKPQVEEDSDNHPDTSIPSETTPDGGASDL